MQQCELKNIHNYNKDLKSIDKAFLKEVMEQLGKKSNKKLSAKFLYDEEGSILFEEITKTKDYYPTKCETEILNTHIQDINNSIAENICLIEYGSGSSVKTRILLEKLTNLELYIPIDISKEYLSESSKILLNLYPKLNIHPICADFLEITSIPKIYNIKNKNVNNIVYFSGSSIGNMEKEDAILLLKNIANICGENGGALISIDLKKSPTILHKAYNDSENVTAKFNLNILKRINKTFNLNININNFCHYAFYNAPKSRIEMHLVSLEKQKFLLNDTEINFSKGESIWTECSYKYTIEEFIDLAKQANLKSQKVWTDKNNLFSMHYLKLSK